ncbi:C40 family peptidase [Geminocystis sp. NIES-3709]|uniref:C40 family peptidase n=1 Tax=Geminocystis sp. NIES-3709 TaxID=1617448 RepID=UPI0005FCD70B|nr:C40 family peptidase [Geminocystis sp. NIES-3709]BAQ66131.1 NLP/P60 [Geminocystis sp. NIES-3709]
MLDSLPKSNSEEFYSVKNLNLYAKSDCKELATQMAKGRQLKIISPSIVDNAIKICLCEDHYPAWLSIEDLSFLKPASKPYSSTFISQEKIASLIPKIIEFTYLAMNTPNYYLWGGTVAPNYDCSGLIQSAFTSVGIWLPRDSYQQENFATKITINELRSGDLIFFGTKRVTHVALYLGNDRYIHSSGKEIGNNGIGINLIRGDLDIVSQNYYKQFWSCGRITQSLP